MVIFDEESTGGDGFALQHPIYLHFSHIGFPAKVKFGANHKKARFLTIPTKCVIVHKLRKKQGTSQNVLKGGLLSSRCVTTRFQRAILDTCLDCPFSFIF